jgi:hypothetical protein
VRIEKQAIDCAIEYLSTEGYSVRDVSRVRGHNGYDLLAERGTETLRVEVKGCSREWQIPDLFDTEFDKDRRLIADILCVVYFANDLATHLCLIPRDAIPPDVVVEKRTYRLRSSFKKRAVLEVFVKPVSSKQPARIER